MVKRSLRLLLLALLQVTSAATAAGHSPAPRTEADISARGRLAAAHALEARGDAPALAAAAALVFVGPPSRSRVETAKAATAALAMAVQAGDLAPNDPAIGWLRLNVCADAPSCDIRAAATTLRWVDADNAAAWLPTLAVAQRDRDAVQVDRVLNDMAAAARFDLYGNRTTVMMFDALQRVRAALPSGYAQSDLTRLTEAMGVATAVVMPSFSPLINACRETPGAERREACLLLAKTMQKSDAVLAQLVGFALAKRLMPADSRELRTIAERRRVLEWRASMANISDTPLLPWLRNARARARLAKMRALHREEDVDIALLKNHGTPLEPPEDHR